MTSPLFRPLDPAAAPDPVTPRDAPSHPEGYAMVTPAGTGPAPAPYDISAPQDIAGIAAAVQSAGALSGAGIMYPRGPRQSEAGAILESPQGAASSNVFAGFPDYENTDIRPGANMETPIQGHTSDYPGTTQDGIPQFTSAFPGGVPGVSPDPGSMAASPGGDYPGTTQDGLAKYGTSQMGEKLLRAAGLPSVTIGRYRIERGPHRWHRQGICDERAGRGVGHSPTLLHAMVALYRWKRTEAAPAQ